MRSCEVMRCISQHAHISGRELSRQLGHVETWATNSFGRIPKLDTLADVADVCGCDVLIIDRATGAEVCRVDPPRREADA